MINLFLVDDHQIVLDGLKSLLSPIPSINIVGQARNGLDLLKQLQVVQPDIVLMDIGMPDMDGIEASRAVKERYPNIKILICTTHSETFKVKKCLQTGVEGYLLKGSGRGELIDALNRLMAGDTYYDPRIVNVVMDSFNKKKRDRRNELTPREIEVIQLISEGKKTKEIAEKLYLSPYTIETHRKNIFAKLGINNVAELMRYALENGIVDL